MVEPNVMPFINYIETLLPSGYQIIKKQLKLTQTYIQFIQNVRELRKDNINWLYPSILYVIENDLKIAVKQRSQKTITNQTSGRYVLISTRRYPGSITYIRTENRPTTEIITEITNKIKTRNVRLPEWVPGLDTLNVVILTDLPMLSLKHKNITPKLNAQLASLKPTDIESILSQPFQINSIFLDGSFLFSQISLSSSQSWLREVHKYVETKVSPDLVSLSPKDQGYVYDVYVGKYKQVSKKLTLEKVLETYSGIVTVGPYQMFGGFLMNGDFVANRHVWEDLKAYESKNTTDSLKLQYCRKSYNFFDYFYPPIGTKLADTVRFKQRIVDSEKIRLGPKQTLPTLQTVIYDHSNYLIRLEHEIEVVEYTTNPININTYIDGYRSKGIRVLNDVNYSRKCGDLLFQGGLLVGMMCARCVYPPENTIFQDFRTDPDCASSVDFVPDTFVGSIWLKEKLLVDSQLTTVLSSNPLNIAQYANWKKVGSEGIPFNSGRLRIEGILLDDAPILCRFREKSGPPNYVSTLKLNDFTAWKDAIYKKLRIIGGKGVGKSHLVKELIRVGGYIIIDSDDYGRYVSRKLVDLETDDDQIIDAMITDHLDFEITTPSYFDQLALVTFQQIKAVGRVRTYQEIVHMFNTLYGKQFSETVTDSNYGLMKFETAILSRLTQIGFAGTVILLNHTALETIDGIPTEKTIYMGSIFDPSLGVLGREVSLDKSSEEVMSQLLLTIFYKLKDSPRPTYTSGAIAYSLLES